VALQGTLDTFSLPDVLRLLATTGKTGCLHVDGDRGRGQVWIDDGALVGATAERALGEPSVDEVVFEMLRFGRGSFSFAVDEKAPEDAEPADVEGTLRRAGQLLDEWRELEQVVPSLNHRVAMAPELTVEQVTVDADRWKALVAIASGRSVGELAERLGMGELGISRTVSDLVELGVAVVESPGSARTSASSSRRNVTDIGSRSATDAPRRTSRDAGSRRSDPVAAPTSDGAPQVNWAQTAEPMAAPDNGGRSRPASGTRLASRNSVASLGTSPEASVAAAGGRLLASPATAVGVVTPATGTPQLDASAGSKARRQASTARSARSRRSAPPATGPSLGPSRGSTLSALPVPPTDGGLAQAMPAMPSSMPSPVGEPTMPITGPIFPPSLETSPPSGLLLPPSLETRMPLAPAPAPLPPPHETGQIPSIAASSLPAEMSWAAQDNEAPIGPPTSVAPAPSALRPPPPGRLAPPKAPRGPVRHEGDPAQHVVAMSPEARAAVEATVGRGGGGPAGMPMAGATQEQVLSRGQLFHYLTSIRG
jgi:hypothetical protein